MAQKRIHEPPILTPLFLGMNIISNAWREWFTNIMQRFNDRSTFELDAAGILYFGDPDTNDSWRIVRSGDDLLIQQREAGAWNTKSTIAGA